MALQVNAMGILQCIWFVLMPLCGSQLLVNMKNKGNEILRESIQGNTAEDTVSLEFQKSDGTLVTQFIDFQNEIQVFRSVVLGEEELGQAAPQTMCFITRFVKNEFITSDAMSKLRQKNPSAIRNPEDDKGVEMLTLDLQINVDKSNVFSPYVSKLCEADAKNSTYGRIADLKVISRTMNKDYSILLGATIHSPLDKVPSCSMVTDTSSACLCRYEICVGWYPCGLKFCHGKDAAGKTVSYRCGIKTCKKCRIFDYFVPRKMDCLWDQPE